MSCRGIQLRLEADHGRLSPRDREHLASCPECAAHRSLLQALQLDARTSEPDPPSTALLARVEGQALAALRAAAAPSPFRREVLLPLGVSLFALPIAVAQGWLWLSGLFLLLESWLPIPLLTGISIFYVASVGLSLGALYASLPFAVAHANRIRPEAP